MPKVDERSPAVVVGPTEREALATALRSDADVLAGYLFGSQATGTAGPLSDVDVAVWLEPNPTRRRAFTRQLELK